VHRWRENKGKIEDATEGKNKRKKETQIKTQ
jgi:hypothetical protein